MFFTSLAGMLNYRLILHGLMFQDLGGKMSCIPGSQSEKHAYFGLFGGGGGGGGASII